jgi:Superfamily I DNA and RNA helicases
MDVPDILESLNDAQREAVTAPAGPLLVLAGAGSGKTRVLVHRIAWLIRVATVAPHSILAVTFTNKAAAEMKSRIETLLRLPLGSMWVGTFHGLAHRLLRTHWHAAALPESFQIIDAQDQQRLIRQVLGALQLDEVKWAPKQVQGFINACKDEGLRPDHVEHNGQLYLKQMVRIYSAYEEICGRAGLVDFAELLLRVYELWRNYPELLTHYRQRFQHILVDEFQDTNAIQYAWLRLLSEGQGDVFAVGDDDQSIYGWRGARMENIQRFNKEFREAHVLRLEQNYRSTATILNAANGLIAHNTSRLGKTLWTRGEQGGLILHYAAFNEVDEARFVVDRIRQWIAQGHASREAAILYRSNAQSRVFEETLIAANMPYRVYGGLRFFERAEIKDALAYLRLIVNQEDDASFERVVNTPTRGIGERTVEVLRAHARAQGISLWLAAQAHLKQRLLSTRSGNAVNEFLSLIERLAVEIPQLTLREQVEWVIKESGLIEHYQKEKGESGHTRVENLGELVNAAQSFEYQAQGNDALDMLSTFLAHAALESGDNQGDAKEDCIHLMTLHSAKGLEFPLVFLCGLEEGLCPHRLSIEDPERLEEERRLCYVGITRAKQQLLLTCAEKRRLHGAYIDTQPSRFIREVPAELIQELRPRASVTRPLYTRSNASSDSTSYGLWQGQRVRHAKFGEGVILSCEGQGSHTRVQVNFDQGGAKWLVLAYAKLDFV